jgi:CHAT domain-containing protein/Tfp pilus assembly protein PilF
MRARTCGVAIIPLLIACSSSWPVVADSAKPTLESLSKEAAAIHSRGDYRDAVQAYRRVLDALNGTGDCFREGVVRNNLGAVHWQLGESEAALQELGKALEIRELLNDELGQAYTLTAIASVHWSQGEHQSALESYRRSIDKWTRLKQPSGEANARNGLGLVYLALGDYEASLGEQSAALRLWRDSSNPLGQAYSINNIGLIRDAYGNPTQASADFESALKLLHANPDARAEAYVRHNLGTALSKLGRYPQSLQELEASLAIKRRLGDRFGESYTLQRIGITGLLQENYGEAERILARALDLSRAIGDRAGEASASHAIARNLRMQGSHEEAIEAIEISLQLTEETRLELHNPELRTTFLGTHRDRYDFLVDTLLELHSLRPDEGFDRRAFEAAERGRARLLLDSLSHSKGEIQADVNPDLLARERQLERRVNAASDRLRRITSARHTTEQAAEALANLRSSMSELSELRSQRKATRLGSLEAPSLRSIEDLQRSLRPGQVMLSYWLGDERSAVWIVARNSYQLKLLPPRKVIDELTRELLSAIDEHNLTLPGESHATRAARLTKADRRFETLAQRLSQHLFVGLPKSTVRTIVVPDGSLWRVPFSALSIRVDALTPSASFIPQGQGTAAWTQAYVLADPELASTENLPPLPFSRQEADTIARLIPAGTTMLAGIHAKAERLRTDSARQAAILHFGTHAIVDEQRPELSRLLLTGPPLRLHEIYNLNLAAQLVVVSGCRTAQGKLVGGEGLMSFTRGFLFAGASRVLASAWAVDDQATASLMTAFYKALLKDALPPAAALRKAQSYMRADPRWSSPYYWSGFQLYGDWR